MIVSFAKVTYSTDKLQDLGDYGKLKHEIRTGAQVK